MNSQVEYVSGSIGVIGGRGLECPDKLAIVDTQDVVRPPTVMAKILHDIQKRTKKSSAVTKTMTLKEWFNKIFLVRNIRHFNSASLNYTSFLVT